ncbi:FadR family transcriptional regulator [Microbulbifer thermotolerans]|uniref:FadR family transcriptional regulator n=1 Tax=Microbulbifer thermotolerans TaxID=252514 RepID=A0AB35HVD3_MICTH|nr:FadR/GntR family transcriptional regulator [Microbulbifer thermotolerans]MCX2780279.1 FadR family transcriptional regulator [Microbulbifer thermotolerans]MCX2782742.1 FadR family transcriptional regulator [Microbulbifer thermotolerans]MCX2795497.1 FadR family transcriptional regulator [Microbulbifer thermotolerans]MCX2800210.1 FadR family transcriptional regulator [Microbulbifer thermotolerans]MCX2805296.1 FadR family transcriptional regulator [Microbulbifer thermotolerans]
MPTQFQAIAESNRNLNIQIAREIAQKILSGTLAQGSIIPGEVYLCSQFGVSRTVLREAIKLLKSKGMLESKPKVGTRVCCKTRWNFLDAQLLEWMTEVETPEDVYLQFLELRRAIEPQATALAAVRATEEQRTELTTIFQQMKAIAKDFDQQAWTEVDTQFHHLIFLATDNSFYRPFGNVMATMLKWFIRFSSKDGGVCIEEHRQIYEAIMDRDPVRAMQASMSLMENHNHRLSEPQSVPI